MSDPVYINSISTLDNLACSIRGLNQVGKPFKRWDGNTLCNSGPSESSKDCIDVYGPGSKYYIRLTYEELSYLYYHTYTMQISSVSGEGDFRMQLATSAQGILCETTKSAKKTCRYTEWYDYNSSSSPGDTSDIRRGYDGHISEMEQLRAKCTYYPMCLEDDGPYFYQFCDMAALSSGACGGSGCVDRIIMDKYIRDAHGAFKYSESDIVDLNFDVSNFVLTAGSANSSCVQIPGDIEARAVGGVHFNPRGILGGVLYYMYAQPCFAPEAAGLSYEGIPSNGQWYALAAFAQTQGYQQMFPDGSAAGGEVAPIIDNFITNGGYFAAGNSGCVDGYCPFLIAFMPRVPRVQFDVIRVGDVNDPLVEYWWNPGLNVSSTLGGNIGSVAISNVPGEDTGKKHAPCRKIYPFEPTTYYNEVNILCDGPGDAASTNFSWSFLMNSTGYNPSVTRIGRVKVVLDIGKKHFEGYMFIGASSSDGTFAGEYEDNQVDRNGATSHTTASYSVEGIFHMTVYILGKTFDSEFE
jgi:hypothetical protein